ncbi:MAG: hypothetical protein AAFX02_03325 [Pseudomonadota bacterium]
MALRRVWLLVAGVLRVLHALPGLAGACLPGPVWARAFAELRQAEAAARRALFVMAAEPGPDHAEPTGLPPEAAPAPGKSPALSPTSRSKLPPVFNLSDPLPDPMALDGLTEAPGSAGPIASSGAPRPSAGLKVRMAALQAVLDDPGPALARFLRRRDWPRRHIFDPGTAPRLRPGHPPGFDVRRALEWAMDALMEIHTLAMAGSRAPPA